MDLILKAQQLYKKGKYRESRDIYDLDFENSNNKKSLFGSAVCDYELKNFKSSLEKLNKLMDEDPENCHIYNQIGIISFKVGDNATARFMFEKAIEKNKAFKDGYYNLLETLGMADIKYRFHILRALIYQFPKEKEALVESISIIENQGFGQENLPFLIGMLNEIEPKNSLVKRYKDLVIQKNRIVLEKTNRPLKILFLQTTPCIRNYKYTQALSYRGHSVSLAYTEKKLSEVYTGLSDEIYHDLIKINNFRDLWDLSAHYDIIHSHNEPDTLTVAALAGDCPVVHDTHDLISLRDPEDQNVKFFEGIANRGAHGLIYSTPYQKSEARFLYGGEKPTLVYYNYASSEDLPSKYLPKLSAKDGNTHIVYEGGISFNKHRNFVEILKAVAKDRIHVHIFPARYDDQMAAHFNDFPNIHYNFPVSPKRIIFEMSRFDFGIIPWNLQKGQKKFLDSTIANKLFEYIAAGLPVFTSEVKSYVDYFKENPTGMIFENAEDLIYKIPLLKEQAENIDFMKYVKTYESEIDKLETFYYMVIDSTIIKKTSQNLTFPVHGTENIPKPVYT